MSSRRLIINSTIILYFLHIVSQKYPPQTPKTLRWVYKQSSYNNSIAWIETNREVSPYCDLLLVLTLTHNKTLLSDSFKCDVISVNGNLTSGESIIPNLNKQYLIGVGFGSSNKRGINLNKLFHFANAN